MSIDVERIIRILLSMMDRDDKLIWHFTKSGRYTVKSSYHVAVHFDTKLAHSIVLGGWKRIWNLHMPPKFKIFMRCLL